jgi:hypothetical protein
MDSTERPVVLEALGVGSRSQMDKEPGVALQRPLQAYKERAAVQVVVRVVRIL